MRYDKFTIKSQELIQNAQDLASHQKNPQLEPEHLLSAMLTETEGIAGETFIVGGPRYVTLWDYLTIAATAVATVTRDK